MNKRVAIIIITVMVMAAMFLSCEQKPPAQYEDEGNFDVVPINNGKATRIVDYLDYSEKNFLNIPPRIKELPVTEIGEGAISDCFFYEVTMPDTVVNIMDFAFSDNNIRGIQLPKKLTEIGNGTFMNNRLTNIVIPDSVKKIGYRAFFNNPIEMITIGKNVEFVSLIGFDTMSQKSWKYTSFEGLGFDEFYEESGRKAGVYTRNGDGSWDVKFR